jgi:hypothetical protein
MDAVWVVLSIFWMRTEWGGGTRDYSVARGEFSARRTEVAKDVKGEFTD